MANKDPEGAYVRSIVAKMDDTKKESPTKSPPRRPAPSYLGVSRTNSGYNNSLLYGADHRMDQSGNITNGSGKPLNGNNSKPPTYVSLAMLGPDKPKTPSKYSDLGLSLKSPERNCRSFLRNISSFEKIAKEGQGQALGQQVPDTEAVTMVGKKMQHLLHLDADVPDACVVQAVPDHVSRINSEIVPKKMEDFIDAVDTLLSTVEDRSVAEGLGKPDHDGNFFRRVAATQRERLVKLCAAASAELEQNVDMPDDASGRLRAAMGKARLLMNERFIQFDGLCQDNLHPPPGSNAVGPVDLAGFWDMVLIEVHSVYNEFRDIKDLKKNNWVSVTVERVVKSKTRKKVAQKSPSATAKSQVLSKERKKRIDELRKMKCTADKNGEVEICLPLAKKSP